MLCTNKHHASALTLGILVGLIGPAKAFTAYVSNEKSNTVSVVDTDRMETVKTIKVGQRPRGIELTKDDRYCLVAVGDDDTIQVIDTKSGEVIANLPSGPDPELFILSPNGKVLYVHTAGSTIDLFDAQTFRHLRTVTLNADMAGFVVLPPPRPASSADR